MLKGSRPRYDLVVECLNDGASLTILARLGLFIQQRFNVPECFISPSPVELPVISWSPPSPVKLCCGKMVVGKRNHRMPTARLTKTIIEAAITGFEAQKRSIDGQIAELRAMLTDGPETEADQAPAKATGRKFSAAARKRMREAQRLRWAKIRGESSAAPAKAPSKTAKPKGGITAAGRKALSIAMKKRWAAKKAAPSKAA